MAVIGTTSKPQTLHRLSIRIAADGFSFVATDPLKGTLWRRDDFPLAASEPLADTLERALQDATEPQYASVEIVVNTPSTRIPLDEFRRDDLPTLYRLVFPATPLQGQDICYTILPQLELAEIFTISHDVRLLLTRHYPLATFRNVAGHELERMFARHRREPQPTLYAHLLGPTLLLAAFEGEGLTFANTFPTSSTADALYFTLYTFQTLKMNAREARILLSGDDDTTEPLAREARRYVKQVNIE